MFDDFKFRLNFNQLNVIYIYKAKSKRRADPTNIPCQSELIKRAIADLFYSSKEVRRGAQIKAIHHIGNVIGYDGHPPEKWAVQVLLVARCEDRLACRLREPEKVFRVVVVPCHLPRPVNRIRYRHVGSRDVRNSSARLRWREGRREREEIRFSLAVGPTWQWRSGSEFQI